MRARFLFFAPAAFCAASAIAAPGIPQALTPGDFPAGCQAIGGLYPVGDRTAKLWAYDDYSAVLPAYKRKQAQSLSCGGQRGTLYYYDYASSAQRERAVLFVRPVLAKEAGASISEWATGFVVVSFADAPAALLESVEARVSGRSSPAASAPPPPPAPPRASVSSPKAAEPTPVAPAPSAPASDGLSVPAPAAKTQPFEAAPGTKALTSRQAPPPAPAARAEPKPSRPAEPVRTPPAESAAPPAPAESARLPEPPKPVPARPVKSYPLAAPTPAPTGVASDLSSAVLENFASKMGCDTKDRNMQTAQVCGFMQEFASALPPELPFRSDLLLLGPVYTIDTNGRFTDLHYNALAGSASPSVVSFYPLLSTGGKDDFEIKSLVEARKMKASLPVNDMAAKLPEWTAKKRFQLGKSNGRSAVLQVSADRRLFMRRAGEKLLLIGASGATADEQVNNSLVVVVLY